ncbi:MAG: electron transfer flavoprotein subunit alpha [Lentisphaeria bacterium]
MTRANIQIIEKHCTGCGLCARACPFSAITVRETHAVIDYAKCTMCGACASVCKAPGAINYSVTERKITTGRGDVWVICEQYENKIATVSFELLGLARKLADDLGVKVGAVLPGCNLQELPANLISHGADEVFLADNERLANYKDEPYATIAAKIIRKYKPEIVLGGATAIGRALLPRLAVMLHTGLTADCTELRIDSETGLLMQTRPAFGGNLLATITCEQHRPQMATVRPGVMPIPPPQSQRSGKIHNVKVNPEELNSALRWLGSQSTDRKGEDIREADVIVSAGKGVGGPEGVKMVAKLADVLGGALGASRAAVDAGWIDYSHQIGQTGTTVQPDTYIACGISGAVQHLVGMQNATRIIAINRDPDAPIFDYADVAVVGDTGDILPRLLKEL